MLSVVIIIVVTLALVGLWMSFNQKENSDHLAVNEGVVQTKSFSVSSDSTNWNTSARGTVFIWGDNGNATRIRIVASIEIDPNDWGGVVFYIPQNWYVADIISSFPENSNESVPSGYVSAAITGEDESREWKTWIEVARNRSETPSEGGSGTIVIDLVSDRQAIQSSDIAHISVAVGAIEKDGVRTVDLDAIKIPISAASDEPK